MIMIYDSIYETREHIICNMLYGDKNPYYTAECKVAKLLTMVTKMSTFNYLQFPKTAVDKIIDNISNIVDK